MSDEPEQAPRSRGRRRAKPRHDSGRPGGSSGGGQLRLPPRRLLPRLQHRNRSLRQPRKLGTHRRPPETGGPCGSGRRALGARFRSLPGVEGLGTMTRSFEALKEEFGEAIEFGPELRGGADARPPRGLLWAQIAAALKSIAPVHTI